MAERYDPQKARARQFRTWMENVNGAPGLRDPHDNEHQGKVSVFVADEKSDEGVFRDTTVVVYFKRPAAEEPVEVWSSQGPNEQTLAELGLPVIGDREGRPIADSSYPSYAQSWRDRQDALAEAQARAARGKLNVIDLVPIVREHVDARDTQARLEAAERRHRAEIAEINRRIAGLNEISQLAVASVPFAPQIRDGLGHMLGGRKTKWGQDLQDRALHMLVPDSKRGGPPPTRRVGPGAYVVDHERGKVHHGLRGIFEGKGGK